MSLEDFGTLKRFGNSILGLRETCITISLSVYSLASCAVTPFSILFPSFLFQLELKMPERDEYLLVEPSFLKEIRQRQPTIREAVGTH